MKSIVFTNGCFDILHPAHYNLLAYCRYLAGPDGQVYIGLDSDAKVRVDKGNERPIFTYEERRNNLLSLKCYESNIGLIDNVFSFSTNEELHSLIKSLNPDTIVKGSDWQGNVVGSDIATVALFPYDDKLSTTNIIKKVFENHSCGWSIIAKAVEESDTEFKVDPFERNE